MWSGCSGLYGAAVSVADWCCVSGATQNTTPLASLGTAVDRSGGSSDGQVSLEILTVHRDWPINVHINIKCELHVIDCFCREKLVLKRICFTALLLPSACVIVDVCCPLQLHMVSA